jgi:sec-independent protein translocase protein TatA
MGLDNPTHLLLLFVLVLLVFGARRLPEIGRSLGSGLREFKQSISGESHAQAPQQPVAQPQQTLPPAPTPAAPQQQPVGQPQGPPQAQDAFAQRETVPSDRG